MPVVNEKVKSPRKRLSGKLIAGVRARMQLGVPDFAACLGVSLATAYRWEAAIWPRLRPSVAALVIALDGMSDEALKKLGAAVAKACASDEAFAAPRLVLDAVAA